MAEVQAPIAGRLYRLACDDGQEEHLLGLARRLDTRMAEMRVRFGELGDQRIAVMAALTFADEADEAERRAAGGIPPIERAQADLHPKVADHVASALDALSQRLQAVVRLLQPPPQTPPG